MREAPTALGSGPKAAAKEHGGGEEPEVKGFMTLNEISLKTGVPKDWLVKELAHGSGVDPRQPLREWMHDRGKSIQDIRDAVTKYRRQVSR